jgi:hypothetical protein
MKIAKAAAVVVGSTFLFMVFRPDILLVPFALLFGWIPSLNRFVSVAHLSTGSVFAAMALSGLLVAGTHYFCGWVHGERRASVRWKWKWTFASYALLLFLLGASAALVGIAHQTAWMLTSGEPVFKSRLGIASEKVRLWQMGDEVLRMMSSNAWDFSKLQSSTSGRGGERPAWEDFSFYFLAGTNGRAGRVVFIRRDPKHQKEIGVVQDGVFDTKRPSELSKMIRVETR